MAELRLTITNDILVDVIEDNLSERYETKVLRALAEDILKEANIELYKRTLALLLFQASGLDPDDYKRR